MLKVLLVNPPRSAKVLGLEEDKLGILYLASVLLANGIDAAVYDAQVENNSLNELRDLIKSYRPSIVGITITTTVSVIFNSQDIGIAIITTC